MIFGSTDSLPVLGVTIVGVAAVAPVVPVGPVGLVAVGVNVSVCCSDGGGTIWAVSELLEPQPASTAAAIAGSTANRGLRDMRPGG